MNDERLSEAELAYHQEVIAQVQAVNAINASWSAFLAARYQLGPRDTIDLNGQIVREGALAPALRALISQDSA